MTERLSGTYGKVPLGRLRAALAVLLGYSVLYRVEIDGSAEPEPTIRFTGPRFRISESVLKDVRLPGVWMRAPDQRR